MICHSQSNKGHPNKEKEKCGSLPTANIVGAVGKREYVKEKECIKRGWNKIHKTKINKIKDNVTNEIKKIYKMKLNEIDWIIPKQINLSKIK